MKAEFKTDEGHVLRVDFDTFFANGGMVLSVHDYEIDKDMVIVLNRDDATKLAALIDLNCGGKNG